VTHANRARASRRTARCTNAGCCPGTACNASGCNVVYAFEKGRESEGGAVGAREKKDEESEWLHGWYEITGFSVKRKKGKERRDKSDF
jgi:hypothetical protein